MPHLSPTQRLTSWVEIAVLVGCTLLLLQGLSCRADLQPTDELLFLEQGLQLAAGHWPSGLLAWAPLLSSTYGALALLGVPTWLAADVMTGLTALGSALALRWALRGFVPGSIAFFLAWSWLCSDFLLQPENPILSVTRPEFASIFGFVAVGCWARGHLGISVLALAAATLERSDYIAWSATLAALLVLADVRRRPRRLRPRTLAVVGLVLLSASVLLLDPAHRDRSWLAFQQHYAARSELREGAAGEEILVRMMQQFEQPEARTERDFGAARSIGAALRANPAQFLDHALTNGRDAIPALGRLLTLRFTWFTGGMTAWCVLALAPLALALLRRRHLLRQALAGWPDGLLLLLLSSGGMLAAALAVAPRSALLYPTVVALSAALGLGWQVWSSSGRELRESSSTVPALFALLVIWLAPHPFPPYPEFHLMLRPAVELVREAIPPGEADVFAVNGQAIPGYADRPDLLGRGPSFTEAAQGVPLRELVNRPPKYVIVHAMLIGSLPAFTQELLEFVRSHDYRLSEMTPRCLLYERR